MNLKLNARLNEISFVDDDDYDVDMLELSFACDDVSYFHMTFYVSREEAQQLQLLPGQMFKLTLERKQ